MLLYLSNASFSAFNITFRHFQFGGTWVLLWYAELKFDIYADSHFFTFNFMQVVERQLQTEMKAPGM